MPQPPKPYPVARKQVGLFRQAVATDGGVAQTVIPTRRNGRSWSELTPVAQARNDIPREVE